jgi:outer membrane protein TolC
MLRLLIPVAFALALAACGAPADLPLPTKPDLADNLGSLHRDGINTAAPLTVMQVALLAVQNNPDLRAVRAQHGVARAQVLQAGLLPNPQFTGAFLPLVAGVGTTPAYNAGISQDIRALITLSNSRAAARASAGQVDAQILWQEWQVIGQARLLAVDIIEAERSLALLARNRDLLAARYRRSQRAVAAGNETLTVSAPDLAALQTTTTQINDLQRQQLSRRHQLNALLGLAPEVPVSLDPRPDIPPWNVDTVAHALPTLAQRRPDLVALQLGYRAQNAKLRTAILSRFPNLVFGVTGGSDNSNVRNLGPQVTLELPIFNQNQGNIAIERATRQQLRDEYQAQLDAAYTAVGRLITEQQQLEEQYRSSLASVEQLRSAADTAERVYRAGNLDERSYVDLRAALLAKQNETIKLEQTILEQRVTLQTLIGSNLPTLTAPTPGAGR